MSTKMFLPDVLAERYASAAMVNFWSPTQKVLLMRRLWIAGMEAQKKLGLDIPDTVLEAYKSVVGIVDLASIAERERRTRHDVTANIEEFNHLAGGIQHIHRGFTSRDVTDNMEQLQIYRSMQLVRDRTVTVLARLQDKALRYAMLDMCARTHNIPAQTTTLGKRFATVAEELLIAFERLEYLIAHYPLRGIKGPVGTQQDMVSLLGSPAKALKFEELIREYLGLPALFDSVGQVYPRSLDFAVVSTLMQLASAPANLAVTLRLMAGFELAHEGFKEGQDGSSSMPHKINSRTCERVCGLRDVLGGFLEMTKSLVGNQWGEGDVSCSVVRRVALPGAFFALDGLYESMLTVLAEMEIFPRMIGTELNRYLPFLSTSRLLMEATQVGMGREDARTIIKKHSVTAVSEMRSGGLNCLVELLTDDSHFLLDQEMIEYLVLSPDHGLVDTQVGKVCLRIKQVTGAYPDAVEYVPEPIL